MKDFVQALKDLGPILLMILLLYFSTKALICGDLEIFVIYTSFIYLLNE